MNILALPIILFHSLLYYATFRFVAFIVFRYLITSLFWTYSLKWLHTKIFMFLFNIIILMHYYFKYECFGLLNNYLPCSRIFCPFRVVTCFFFRSLITSSCHQIIVLLLTGFHLYSSFVSFWLSTLCGLASLFLEIIYNLLSLLIN